MWLTLACAEADLDQEGSFPAVALIPAPLSLEQSDGGFVFDAATALGAEGDAVPVAEAFAGWLRPSTGWDLPVATDGAVRFTLSEGLDAEAYSLSVSSTGIEVVASDAAGLYWGAQSLRQLMRPEVYAGEAAKRWAVAAVEIQDAPRFPDRGLMLDVARHFFTVAEIERQIELMAVYKLNRLHLHLTDDQGWRIEIRSWPDLTTIGGSLEVGGGAGGWYSQAEYEGIVAFAAERHVTVIPEIDMPGHAHAALASYPELNEGGVAPELYTGAGVISTPLCLDCPATMGFVEDVIAEVAAMTPAAELHIGGDEAVDVSDADYAAFLVEVQQIVAAQGKTLIGWDEIAGASLDAPFRAQHWWHDELAAEAVTQGGRIIGSPTDHAYFDMMYDADGRFGQVWAGFINVHTAYSWEPTVVGVDVADVDGVEGALWTELIEDEGQMDFMLWPRAAALAEVGWSAEKDWGDFSARLAAHGPRLEAQGVAYYASPEIAWE
jgi:hexosaminidase